MNLNLDSKEKVIAVWTALTQFVENQVEREEGEQATQEEAAAQELLQQLDEFMADHA